MPTIFCQKLRKELPALTQPPLPNALGHHIAQHFSEQAWLEWQTQQTILINEHKLKLFEPQAKNFLRKEMLAFFDLNQEDWG